MTLSSTGIIDTCEASGIEDVGEGCFLAYVIFGVTEPFHESIVNGTRFFGSYIYFRVGRAIVAELVTSEAHASDLEENMTIFLIVQRIKTFKHFSGSNRWVYVFRIFMLNPFGSSSLRGFLCDHILVAVFDSMPLSGKEVHLMKQTRDTIHLNYVLYVLFIA